MTDKKQTSNSDQTGSSISRICENTKITGTIETTGDIRIDGTLEGSVTSTGRVVVGLKGKINGDLHCSCIDVSGKIKGNIIAKDVLILKEKSVLVGEITVQKLIIESGATFNGLCKMPYSEANNENGASRKN
ncbi:MAG: polymer-forming cytoskeletal protein [Prevotellaceae bacterium]|jgi:cytoskeletal protein CcmA (bactofilin family)|nr:polymer-forming cytoskeletal protein [Prevotellaceae bacterium]